MASRMRSTVSQSNVAYRALISSGSIPTSRAAAPDPRAMRFAPWQDSHAGLSSRWNRLIRSRFPPQAGHVDGEDDGRATRVRGSVELPGRDGSDPRRVELIPNGCPTRARDFVKRPGRASRENHLVVHLPRGSRDGQLALCVEGALRTDRCQEDGRGQPRAQQHEIRVDPSHVHEAARSQSDLVESPPIGAKRHFVIHPGGKECVVPLAQISLCDRLEVEHVDRSGRIADQLAGRIGEVRIFREVLRRAHPVRQEQEGTAQ